MSEKQYKKSELMSTIYADKNILSQFDWISRKVLFELCAKFKEAHPDIELPNYEKYKDIEKTAEHLRDEINECESHLEEAEDDQELF